MVYLPLTALMAMVWAQVPTLKKCFHICLAWGVVCPRVTEGQDRGDLGRVMMKSIPIKSHWRICTKERLQNLQARKMSYVATAREVAARRRQRLSSVLRVREKVYVQDDTERMSSTDARQQAPSEDYDLSGQV